MKGIFSKAAILAGLFLSTVVSALPHTAGDNVNGGVVATGVDSIITIDNSAGTPETGLTPRQASAAGPARDVLNVIKGILEQVDRDNKNREKFTQEMISTMRSKYPSFNFVVCHTKHEYQWDGTRGQDWDHWHQEFDIKVGGTIGYEIYWARSGWFTRIGDGGYINWAWGGFLASQSSDGKHLVFRRP